MGWFPAALGVSFVLDDVICMYFCCATEERSHFVSFLLLFFLNFFLGLQISIFEICFVSDVLSRDLLLFNT